VAELDRTLTVIARSNATKQSRTEVDNALDCFATLAMTTRLRD
jgi:hypothetical protein